MINRPNYQCTRTMLLRKYMMDFKVNELDEIMLEFDQTNVIKTETIGNQIVYRMPITIAEQLIQHFKGITTSPKGI